MKPRVYIVRPAVFAPLILSAVAAGVAIQWSWWFLVALPFIWLGSICASPNLNGADGCFAYVAMFVGFAVLPFFRPLGEPVITGTALGFYVSAIEKWARMRAVPDPQVPEDSSE
jgi:hypothetical protein